MRIFRFTIAAALILLLQVSASIAAEPSPLEALVAEALENNPELRAAEERWGMFERKVGPASTLADPQLSLALLNYPVDSFDSNETPMTGKDIKLSQKFPFPGKLAARGESAEQQALWYRGVFEDAKLQLAGKVKSGYYRIYFLDRAVEVTEKSLAVLDDFIRLTETRYSVGKGLQQDVLKAQLERSKLTERLLDLQQKRNSALAALNRQLDRPSAAPLDEIAELDLPEVDVPLADLQEGSENNRPLYGAYSALVERYRKQKELARLDYKPDFTLWAGYRQREDSGMDPVEGADFVSAGVSFNLPVHRDRLAEGVAEADTGIRMALRQYEDFRGKVEFNIHDAYSKYEKSRELSLLYKTGIVPQATQSFAAAMSAYRVGKVDFLTLQDALLSLLRFELEFHRVVADGLDSLASLEAQSGKALAE